MKMQFKIIKVFTDKYPLIGPLLWALSLQYYFIQILVASVWSRPYSLSANTISDLGSTVCNPQYGRYACSPLHSLMNVSFIILGVTMAFGSLFIYHEFKYHRGSLIGFGGLLLAGIGTVVVGLVPENVNITLHAYGAALPFLVGNIGLIVLGATLVLPRWLRIYTILSGAIPVVVLAPFLQEHYFGLGIGGLERVIAYPQTTWLIFFGIYMSRNRYEIVRSQRMK